jgi:hypothetical protein
MRGGGGGGVAGVLLYTGAQINCGNLTPFLTVAILILQEIPRFSFLSFLSNSLLYTVNVDCVKLEYVVLAKYHHMLIFEFDLLTK